MKGAVENRKFGGIEWKRKANLWNENGPRIIQDFGNKLEKIRNGNIVEVGNSFDEFKLGSMVSMNIISILSNFENARFGIFVELINAVMSKAYSKFISGSERAMMRNSSWKSSTVGSLTEPIN